MGYLDDDTDVVTNHNVYILGAGFSKNAGLPLLSGFLNEMRSSVNWLKKNERPELRATRGVLLFRKRAASAALRVNLNVENIEDLFSLAAASGKEADAENISTAIAATIEYSRTHAPNLRPMEVTAADDFPTPPSWTKTGGDEHKTRFEVQLYDLYAGLLNGDLCAPQDYMANTVISFNYDTILEDALLRIGVPIDYGFQKDSVEYDEGWEKAQTKNQQLRVLKIHGSINWFQRERELQNLTVYRSYNDGYTKGKVVLIPPTWRKDFSGPLSDVWRGAIHALREATRIIFLGFSFPDTDAHIKYLLAAGLQENISLRNIYCINPSPEVKDNYLKIIKRDLEDQKIATFCPIYTSQLINRFARQQDSYPARFNRPMSQGISIAPFTLSGEEGQEGERPWNELSA